MTHVIHITPKANADIDAAVAWRSRRSIPAAVRWQLYGCRRDVCRVLFVIDGATVNVLRVRHAAQDRLTADDL